LNTSPIVFSVVIPLFNRERTIARALESVLNQTYELFELVVVDDGSTDNGVAEVLRFQDHRISLLRQANAGVSAARNTGIRRSSGQYVAFLDADDTWEPGYLESQLKLIQLFPNMGAYATAYYLRYPEAPPRVAAMAGVPACLDGGVLEDYFKCAALGSNPLWTGSTCIPRAILSEMNGFPEGIRLHEDHYLWTKIASIYPIAYCPVPLATYFKFEDDSACKDGVMATQDFAFFLLLDEMLSSDKLSLESRIYVRKYLNQWVIRDAIKAGSAADQVTVKACLAMYRPESIFASINRILFNLYFLLPARFQRFMRVTSRWVKGLYRTSHYPSLRRGTIDCGK
jgi:glycosyltransferase involved in cell wall biosynthesis